MINRKKPRRVTILCCGAVFMVIVFSLHKSLKPSPQQWLPWILRKSKFQSHMSDRNHVYKFNMTRIPSEKNMKILLWTEYFNFDTWDRDLLKAFSSCKSEKRCSVTQNKNELDSSDAVLFHAMNMWFEQLRFRSFPKRQKTEQIWIMCNYEPAGHLPVNFKRTGVSFNWTMTYRLDSDIFTPYGSYEKRTVPSHSRLQTPKKKRSGIFWVASNCGDQSRRQLLVKEIQKYIHVDTFGVCGQNGNENLDWHGYKFYLALENSYCRDYISEKFWSTLARHQVPVVAGGADYRSLAPPNSYIDISDFNSIKNLADYLKYLESNDTAYNEYFEWTRTYTLIKKDPFCELCEELHKPHQHQVYLDMDKYIADDTCDIFTVGSYIYQKLQGHAIRLGIV